MHKPTDWARRSLVAVTALVATMILVNTPARADAGVRDKAIEVAPVARSQAHGAGLVVGVDLSCNIGDDVRVDLRVTQSGPQGPVGGGIYTGAICSEERQTLRIAVLATDPDTGGRSTPFQPGSALVSVVYDHCGATGCGSGEAYRTVRVRERTVDQSHAEQPNLSFDLRRRGEVLAAGAGARVKVRYTCAAGIEGFFGATLGQLDPSGIVSTGEDAETLSCTDKPRSGVLVFHARSADWELGDAFLIVNGFHCDEVACPYLLGFRTVELT